MCTSHDSRPPIEPISGAAVDAGSVTIRSLDGAEFRAYLARPKEASGAGIVILPDVRGLHPFFEELALRYAERGISALAIDYFCRTAGTDERGEDFEYMPHVDQAGWPTLRSDILAAIDYLRAETAPRSTFTTGFCMGGRLSSMSATLGKGLAGVIPFYGWPVGPNRNGTPAPADEAARIECDVLAIYGEADTGIPQEARDAYDAALEKAGVGHETVVEPGAPHGFFDRRAEQHREAADDAWNRTLTFIRRHTMGQPFAAAPPASGRAAGSSGPGEPATDPDPDPDPADDPRLRHFTGED